MTEMVYDSRAWTGEIPDYGAMLRRWLGLECPEADWLISVYFHSPVGLEMRERIERFCREASSPLED